MKLRQFSVLTTALLAAQLGTAAFGQAPGAAPDDTATQGTGTTSSPSTGDTARDTTMDSTRRDTTRDTTMDSTRRDTTAADPTTIRDDNRTLADADDRLPATASPIWLLGLVSGVGFAALATGLRVVRRLRGA